MFKKTIFFFVVFFVFNSNAQVGIGTDTPNTSARLDVSASDKGFLPPRISLTSATDNSTILTPATGLLIYNTATAGTIPNNVSPGYYYWSGAKWISIIGSSTSSNIAGNGTTTTLSNFSSVVENLSDNYTLQNSDNGKVITLNSSTTKNITVPSSLSIGFNCMIVQKGTGQINLSASGTTIHNRYGFSKTAGQYAILTLVSISENVFISSGDMSN
jgi:hypothetical protein